MKCIFAVAMLFLVANNLPLAETSVQAQTSVTPEATLRHFYEWYLHALNQNQEPLEKHQAELSKFVTQRLMTSLNRARKRPEGIDADFFIDAQDLDETWEEKHLHFKSQDSGCTSNRQRYAERHIVRR